MKNIKSHFLKYFDQLPIVAFNSVFYEVSFMKAYLRKSLQRFFTSTSINCLERRGRFLLLPTPQLRFLDCSHFVAAGTSLENPLKGYGNEINKVEFPYEHSTYFDVLRETSMPPYESFFFFSLKYENVLVVEMSSYFCNGGSLDDPNHPNTGSNNYDDIEQTW